MSLHSSLSNSRSFSISSASSDEFWQQFDGQKYKAKLTFTATLKSKVRTLLGKKQPLVSKLAPIRPKPVSRDNFDQLIKDFEIKLNLSKHRDDSDYLREYTLNFNKWRTTKYFQEALSPLYDDVFSESSYKEGGSSYSDVFENGSDMETYSDVCESSVFESSVIDDTEDYSEVYSSCEYSNILNYCLEEVHFASVPPHLPRRMSDSRPPARPSVPSRPVICPPRPAPMPRRMY